MKAKIMCLPGDGIGPEIMEAAVGVLTSVACAFSHSFTFITEKIGGASIDAYGTPLTEETLEACKSTDAILLGAVGGPKWDSLIGDMRPESGLLKLRKELGLYCNLRPCKIFEALESASPLQPNITKQGIDLLIVRELTGDVYFGRHSVSTDGQSALDEMAYTTEEIERVARMAFRAAQKRRNSVCSVDKANVLSTSRLWRETVTRVSHDYPEIKLTHMYIDNCAMQLVLNPSQFDVILTSNLFGDILSDEAAAIAGSPGVMPSSSIGNNKPDLYEPIHGSAPDIAGRDTANPIGMILSTAMMLRKTFSLSNEADCIETAVTNVLNAGWRTADLVQSAMPKIGTEAIGQLICEQIDTVGNVLSGFRR